LFKSAQLTPGDTKIKSWYDGMGEWHDEMGRLASAHA
jgi:hypothetical protein